MAPLLSSLLAVVRPSDPADDCLVCMRPVKPADSRMRLPGGGYVHSACSTYRMRQAERIRRKLR